MDNYTYLDVYAKTYLNEIKNKIKQNNITLYGEKEATTDEYMIEVIKSLCIKPRHNLDNKEKFILKILPTNTEEDAERIFITLMLYYTALYNENMELLNKLLEEGFNFGSRRNNLDLFVLDKRISSHFNINLYIELIKKQTQMFKDFFFSLQRNNPVYKQNDPNNQVKELTTDELIEKFANILNQNPNVALSKERKPYSSSNPYEINELLTKQSLNYFSESIILNATEVQKKNIISQTRFMHLTKQSQIKLTNLMTMYNFSTEIYEYWNEILEELSDEELIKINELDRDIFRDISIETDHQLYEKKNIQKTPESYIEKIRKRLKSSKNQELIEQKPKKKKLQLFKKI